MYPPLPLNLIISQNHPPVPDSITAVVSSPRYHHHNHNNNEPLPDVPGSKLRLMCSYGGHIMPRPHDKSLSYVGGDTRIIAVDRHSSLKDLCSHLSRTLLHGKPFALKYHLPNEDLDNLITVSTDEDLENMIDEYDRLTSKPSPSRLRMFLFFSKPDTAVSMGTLLDVDSETWFVEALNNSGILSRVVSDSAAVDCLVNNLHVSSSSNNDLEESHEETVADDGNNNNKKQVKHLLDVHSVPGSPVEENISSSGSSSLSSSIANILPPNPIRVRVDEDGTKLEQRGLYVMEETFGSTVKGMKQDDGFVISPAAASDEVNRLVVSDDRKTPLPLQIVQPRTGGAFGLPSPDSVASDSSIASANSFSETVYYQDLVQPAHVDKKGPGFPTSNNIIKSELQGDQQVQDSGYTPPQQQILDQNQQQQFVYIHRPIGTGQVPISSYYSVYAPPTSHQQPHNPIGQQQQYPVYVMPVGSTQPYNMTLQSAVAPTNVPEVAPSVYKAPVASNPPFIQIPSNQFHQQYVGLPQNIHQPPQTIAIAPSATTNYGYEHGGHTQDQVYFTQQQATVPPQYQSMTPAAAAAALSDASKLFPIDNNI